MLKVIGKNGCSACVVLKEKLTQEGVEFEYVILDEVDNKTRKGYMKKAIQANHMSFPIVLKDDEIISQDEI